MRRNPDRVIVDDPHAVVADLRRATGLFQARTIAALLGTAAPSPTLFASETNKDRSGKHGSEVA